MLGGIVIKALEHFEAGSHQQFAFGSIHSFLYPCKSSSFYNWCHHHCSSWKRAYMDYGLSFAFYRSRLLHENWSVRPLFHLTSEYLALEILRVPFFFFFFKLLACCHVPFFRSHFFPATHTYQPEFDLCFTNYCPASNPTQCSKIDSINEINKYK